ncbi:MAG: tetratricopeptide repeat protein, partial [Litoreibacter sp.]|nr:tetratricopeptide repeat protein [Litoreibacter sp.]
RRGSYDYLGALTQFDALVAYCPDYAEGYNQRAFVHFLSGSYDKALQDLDRTLEITPDHIGALSGRALTLFELGREEQGQLALRAALAFNPWLPERFRLRPLTIPSSSPSRKGLVNQKLSLLERQAIVFERCNG